MKIIGVGRLGRACQVFDILGKSEPVGCLYIKSISGIPKKLSITWSLIHKGTQFIKSIINIVIINNNMLSLLLHCIFICCYYVVCLLHFYIFVYIS